MNPRSLWELLKDTFSKWKRDGGSRLAAALAYYTTFSLAPLLIIAVAIAGFIFGREAVQSQVMEQLRGLIGRDGAELVQTMMKDPRASGSGVIASVIGFVTLLLGATGVFGQLQDALNIIWGANSRPHPGVLGVIRNYFVSFTMVVGIGFLLLVSLIVSAALSALGNFLGNHLSNVIDQWQIVTHIISFLVITLLFAMIYKFLPDVKIKWSDVWIGAAVTSLLFNIGKYLIGFYLGHSGVASAYGAAGSLAVLLIWIYYSAQIFFFGAEFTQVYARKYGSQSRWTDYAVPVSQQTRRGPGVSPAKSVKEPYSTSTR